MALLRSLCESRAASSQVAISPSDPALAEVWGGGRNSASGQSVNATTALRVSTVFACVTIHAQTIAMLSKSVKQVRADGGKDDLPGHRLYKQIRNRPNRWQTSFEFFEYMVGCRWLRGNAYAYINFNPGRQINELVPMDPDRVWPFVKTPSGVIYYLYDNSPPPPPGSELFYQYFPLNAESVILAASEVLHIRGFTRNGIIGMDPITRAAREAIGLALATEEHGARLFSNGAQISKVLTNPNKLSDVTYERLKKQVNGEFAGVSNANKTMILEEGTSIENLSMTMDQAQFLETRKFQVEDIARIFNMPLVLIGHGDKAPTYASAEQFFMSFKTHTVQPEVRRWEEGMERALLYPSEVGQVEIDFNMDTMLRADSVARSTYLQKRYQTSSITPNGIRLFEHENPVDDPAGDQLYIMSNMIPLNQAGQQLAKPQSQEPPTNG